MPVIVMQVICVFILLFVIKMPNFSVGLLRRAKNAPATLKVLFQGFQGLWLSMRSLRIQGITCIKMFVLDKCLIDPFTITIEKGRNLQAHGKWFGTKKQEYRIKKTITKIGKSTCSERCVGVRVWKGHGMGVAGAREKFSVWRFCFMWSLGRNFLFRIRRTSRHQDLGLCKYTLYKEHHQFSF